jgi:hypothetical protein
MNADIILQRFTNHTSNGASDSSLESEGDNSTWRDLRKIYVAVVSDMVAKLSQKLERTLHSLQVQNELLNHEIRAHVPLFKAKGRARARARPLTFNSAKSFMVVQCSGLQERCGKQMHANR